METAVYQGGTWGDVSCWTTEQDVRFSVFRQLDRRSVDVRGDYRVYYPKTDNVPFSIWYQPSLHNYELLINTLDSVNKCGIYIASINTMSYIRYYPQGQDTDKVLYLKKNRLAQWIISYDLKTLRVFCDGEPFHEEILPNYNFNISEGWRNKDAFGLFFRFLNFAVADAKPLFACGLSRINNIPDKLLKHTNKGIATIYGRSEADSKIFINSNTPTWLDFIDKETSIFAYPYMDVTLKIEHSVPIAIMKNILGQDKPVELASAVNNGRELTLQNGYYIAEAGITTVYNRCKKPSHGILNIFTRSGNPKDEVHILCEYQALGCSMNWDSINLVNQDIYDIPNNRIYRCTGKHITAEAYPAVAKEQISSYIGQLYYSESTKDMYICVDAGNNTWKKITP